MFYAILTLAILLMTQSSNAAKRYEITNLLNGKTFGAEFEDDSKGDKWRDKQISKESWGRNPHNILFLNGEEKKPGYTSCSDVMQMDEEALPEPVEVKIGERCEYPIEYIIVETDITQELADKESEKQADKAERKAVKQMKSNINDSDLPAWHKKLLKRLIKEMRD